MTTKPKTTSEIKAMRVSGEILANVLKELSKKLQPGMTTKDLAVIADKELKRLGGEPAFLNYQGFPDVICISVNDEVVHGIPSPHRVIKSGDLVGMDLGVIYKGMITDAAVTVIAGKPNRSADEKLVKDTKKALSVGIKAVHDQVRTGDIGYAIETYLNKYKYGIVRDLVGHGVGHEVHENPNIPNFGRRNTGPWLNKGMTIAIEPMVTLGSGDVKIAGDRWTVLTADGSNSAHFEHTVLITDRGAEILTTLSD